MTMQAPRPFGCPQGNLHFNYTCFTYSWMLHPQFSPIDLSTLQV